MIKYVALMILLSFMLTANGASSDLPYSESGTIYENGDEFWDSNEYELIRYSLSSGETFEVEFFTDYNAELFIVYGDLNDHEDIEEMLTDILYYGDSSRFIAGTYSQDGYAYFSFTPGESMNYNLAIFSYSSGNPYSMDYEVYTNVESGSGFSFGTFIGIAFFIILAIVIFRKIAKPKPKIQPNQQAFYPQQNYQQPGYQQQNYQQPGYQQQNYQQPGYQQPAQQQPTYQQPSQYTADTSTTTPMYCPNCGSQASSGTIICENCGTNITE
ncbi:MAG: hypothetical protein INQ03_13250 [Candidatus Heimdallarchaeota archaeon]|nr:hypothetical protein [Candidatus Heimdallarchaeota archaeon]